jgi:hypothetical protein
MITGAETDPIMLICGQESLAWDTLFERTTSGRVRNVRKCDGAEVGSELYENTVHTVQSGIPRFI